MPLADARAVPQDLHARNVQIEVGNLDLSMTNPVASNVPASGKVMRVNEQDAPDLARNPRFPV